MERLIVLHGDESQLVEDKKNEYIRATNRMVEVFTGEASVQRISEALCEDSLFGDPKFFVLEDIPILKTNGGKGSTDEYQALYSYLCSYEGEHPILLVYHGSLDKRLKSNKAFLKVAEEVELKKLTPDEMLLWTERYVKNAGYHITKDGKQYLRGLLDIWGEVPLVFFKTEMDRLFLFLKEGDAITVELLSREGSDFGVKNIFRFTDAFFKKDVKMIHYLLPFVLKPKEVDRFFSYFEGQLRIQLMVAECASLGLADQAITNKLHELGSTVAPFPIKLAYQRRRTVSAKEVALFLESFSTLAREIRQGKRKYSDFSILCYSYCEGGKVV